MEKAGDDLFRRAKVPRDGTWLPKPYMEGAQTAGQIAGASRRTAGDHHRSIVGGPQQRVGAARWIIVAYASR